MKFARTFGGEILPQYLEIDLFVISKHPGKVSKFGIIFLPFDQMTWILLASAITLIFIAIKYTIQIYSTKYYGSLLILNIVFITA